MAKEEMIEMEGAVEVLAYAGGKMRQRYIRISAGAAPARRRFPVKRRWPTQILSAPRR